jgi:hypothetical protein
MIYSKEGDKLKQIFLHIIKVTLSKFVESSERGPVEAKLGDQMIAKKVRMNIMLIL